MRQLRRCSWCGYDEAYQQYHDTEWGVPCRDDKTLFEFLILEGAQAGLSWIAILKRRDQYRRAFANFNVNMVAQFSEDDVTRLMDDKGIIRNRLKIQSAISNAQHYLTVQHEFGSFSNYIWAFVENTPVVNHWTCHDEIPATTTLSDTISHDMKKRGFKFFGSTICYAYLQAMGIVDDHCIDCFKRL
ncbi:MAG TPA: DNA-3-methyladenine glycosylase I [Porticoccaceae bacterium]|jgi:DNA-3-methyladenine glycosylase I|nr:DNA-3-methyladenine glycosylase I [Porticoccaceae bacterium]